MNTSMNRGRLSRQLLVFWAAVLLLAGAGCQEPQNQLRVDRFTVQFTRMSTEDVSGVVSGDDDDTASSGDDDDTTGSGDDDDSADGDDDDSANTARDGDDDDSAGGDDDDSAGGDDDDSADGDDGQGSGAGVHIPAGTVTKTVRVENLGAGPIDLQVTLEEEYPEAGAFSLTPAPEGTTEGLAEPFNYRVEGNAEMGLVIVFSGVQPGINTGRLRIRNDLIGFDVTVVLQGTVDCVSLGWDADGDGHCVQVDDPDCDDSDPEIRAGATEVCEDGDQIDNDCDGETWVTRDLDGDGYCDLDFSCVGPEEDLRLFGCSGDSEGAITDCDDTDSALSPGEPEVCESGDQIDNNCDPSDDEAVSIAYLEDGDGDGFGAYDPSTGDGLVERCGDPPTGYVLAQEDTDNPGTYVVDCDDNRATVYPGAIEICDGLDNDCDGCNGTGTCSTETGPSELFNDFDADFDGRALCAEDAQGDPLDCDDSNPYAYSGAPERCDGEDNDCDGVVPSEEVDSDSDQYVECEIEPSVINDPVHSFLNEGEVVGGGDCEPNNAAINPAATELVDGLENNCDGLIDPAESDDDGDCFCEADVNDATQACYPNPNVSCISTDKGDCDDSIATVYAGAAELCDGLDNNCDGVIPAGEADDDFDGFVECDPDAVTANHNGVVGFAGGNDCNDDPSDPTAPDTYPGAPEISDSYYDIDGDYTLDSLPGWRLVDNQCPGDAGEGSYCEVDSSDCLTDDCLACTGDERDLDGDLLSEAMGDCDDDNDARHPSLPEICDGIDNDCDGVIPESEQDGDGDGYVVCWPPPGASTTFTGGGDCDPGNGSVNPGASEIADGLDTDCDASTDAEEEADQDGDGQTFIEGDCDDSNATVYDGAPEICDELDNDCDGELSDGTGGTPDEDDTDGDGYTACGDGDCVDSDVDLNSDLTGAGLAAYPGSNLKAVAAAIHPDAVNVCDGWVNDCSSVSGILPYYPSASDSEEEFDDDGDGYVECADSGFDSWTDYLSQANLYLSGGNDCADTGADTQFVGSSSAFDDIYPNAPDQCDGWVNDCTGSSPNEWQPTATASPDEVDEDEDRYIQCSNYISAGATNSSTTLLGGSDCLDTTLAANSYSDEVHPNASEVCDGFDTDCSQYVANSANDTFDPDDVTELDQDGDQYIECGSYEGASTATNANSASIIGGLDCLDESTNSWSAEINPGADDDCDGWDTDCSSGSSFPPNNPGELDQDDDQYFECHQVTDPDWEPPTGILGGGDCLDHSSSSWSEYVNPSASEVCDGYDTDCSQYVADPNENVSTPEAVNEQDDDEDEYFGCEDTVATGYLHPDWEAPSGIVGGADCQDADDSINPGEVDTYANGNLVDNDCDDTVDEESLAAGDIVVTEINARTGQSAHKFFEVYNTLNRPISLVNWTLQDEGSDSLVLSDSLTDLTVQAGAFRLLCRIPTSVESILGGDPCLNTSSWGGDFGLDSPGDEIELVSTNSANPTLLVDAVSWNSQVSNFNETTSLDPTLILSSGSLASDNDTATNTNWCAPIRPWDGATGMGSPAALNTSCDTTKQDNEDDGWCENGRDLNGDGDCDGLDSTNEAGEVTANCSNSPFCDCDDTRSAVNPSQSEEQCDGVDTNCDGTLGGDETDNDSDDYLPCVTYVENGGGFSGARDCLDVSTSTNSYAAQVNPGATEACDGYDTDCSQYVANSSNDTFAPEDSDEVDGDGDQYIDCAGFVTGSTAQNFEGEILTGGDDCNDAVVAVNPGVSENSCDGVDTNCDGVGLSTSEQDNDGDGYLDCSGYTENGGAFSGGSDCLDISTSVNSYSDNVNPGVSSEVCDGYDTDCSQYVANSSNNVFTAEAAGEQDDDNDDYFECTASAGVGYNAGDYSPPSGLVSGADCLDVSTSTNSYAAQVNPGATEACDGYDTDCSSGSATSPPSNEVDDDLDRYMPCSSFVGATTATNGASQTFLGGSDCLDVALGTDAYSDSVHPGVGSDSCDGYDTDCSQYVANPSNNVSTPEALDELDSDGDQYIECSGFVSGTTAQNGESEVLSGGLDCLDVLTSSNSYSDDVHPNATEVCDGYDTDCSSGNSAADDVQELDDDGDQYVECGDFVAGSTAQNSQSETLNGGGDCNDGHSLVIPGTVLAISPGSGTTSAACTDADGDDYCLGGGKDMNGNGDCQDTGEDYDTIQADGSEAIWGDCDDGTAYVAGGEDVVDEVDNDTDGLVDEDCIASGAVAVSELFSDDAQTDPDSMDWFEVVNLSWHDVYIDCWTVADGASDSFTVEPSGTCSTPAGGSGQYEIAREGYEVLVEDASELTGFPAPPLYEWGGTASFSLTDIPADDRVELSSGATLIDSVNYKAAQIFSDDPAATESLEFGQSIVIAYSGSASEVDTLNDLGLNWCEAISTTVWPGFSATPFAAATCTP